MGLCVYCGKPAGWFRTSHSACRESCAAGTAAIIAIVVDKSRATDAAVAGIEAAAGAHLLRDRDLLRAVEDGWAAAVRFGLQEGVIDEAEEERLDALLHRLGTSRTQVDRSRLWEKVETARREQAEKAERTRRREAQQSIRVLFRDAMTAATPGPDGTEPDPQALTRIDADIAAAAAEGDIAETEVRSMVIDAMGEEVERMLDDAFLSVEEEQALSALARHFKLEESDLSEGGVWLRVVRAATLRELMEGRIPQRMKAADHPFRLQKTETLIWIFRDVGYSTIRTRTSFRGGHVGASVRVARGLYLRTGGFRGHPVQEERAVHEDTGLLGITTRHLYFAGRRRRFRIRHDRIVTIEPYSNGFGVVRDGVRAQPETFENGDGWFAYNLLRNIETP